MNGNAAKSFDPEANVMNWSLKSTRHFVEHVDYISYIKGLSSTFTITFSNLSKGRKRIFQGSLIHRPRQPYNPHEQTRSNSMSKPFEIMWVPHLCDWIAKEKPTCNKELIVCFRRRRRRSWGGGLRTEASKSQSWALDIGECSSGNQHQGVRAVHHWLLRSSSTRGS